MVDEIRLSEASFGERELIQSGPRAVKIKLSAKEIKVEISANRYSHQADLKKSVD
jgi:hypothetical protein